MNRKEARRIKQRGFVAPEYRTPEFRKAYGPHLKTVLDLSAKGFESPQTLATTMVIGLGEHQAWTDFSSRLHRPLPIPHPRHKNLHQVLWGMLPPGTPQQKDWPEPDHDLIEWVGDDNSRALLAISLVGRGHDANTIARVHADLLSLTHPLPAQLKWDEAAEATQGLRARILAALGTRTLDEIAAIIAEANGAPAGSLPHITVPVTFGAIAAGLSSSQPETAVAAVALLIRSRPGAFTAHEIPMACREGTPARHAAQIAVDAALKSDTNDATTPTPTE